MSALSRWRRNGMPDVCFVQERTPSTTAKKSLFDRIGERDMRETRAQGNSARSEYQSQVRRIDLGSASV
jgi:hypothetical protein